MSHTKSEAFYDCIVLHFIEACDVLIFPRTAKQRLRIR